MDKRDDDVDAFASVDLIMLEELKGAIAKEKSILKNPCVEVPISGTFTVPFTDDALHDAFVSDLHYGGAKQEELMTRTYDEFKKLTGTLPVKTIRPSGPLIKPLTGEVEGALWLPKLGEYRREVITKGRSTSKSEMVDRWFDEFATLMEGGPRRSARISGKDCGEMFIDGMPRFCDPNDMLDDVVKEAHHKKHRKLDALAAQREIANNKKADLLARMTGKANKKKEWVPITGEGARENRDNKQERKRREKEMQRRLKNDEDFGSW